MGDDDGTSPDRHDQIVAAFHAARLTTLRSAVRHHDALEWSLLLRAQARPDEAVVWELAAEEQHGLAEEARQHLRDLGVEPPARRAPDDG